MVAAHLEGGIWKEMKLRRKLAFADNRKICILLFKEWKTIKEVLSGEVICFDFFFFYERGRPSIVLLI